MEKYFLFFRAFGAIFPARRDLFGLAGVPHARGMLCAQDDGKKTEGARQGLDYPTLYVIQGLAEESGEA